MDGKRTLEPLYADCISVLFVNHKQEKGVSTVAVGMGSGVKHDVRQVIAGPSNPVVQVEDVNKLQGMLDKSSACSG